MEFEKAKSFILNRLKKELPAQRTYHTVAHVLDVYECAERIGKAEGISDSDMKLVLTAAMFHDCGFIIKGDDHELISCDIAKQSLPAFGYSPQEIETICNLVLATRIPQEPKTLLEKIICDADLDYLGRDDFFDIGDRLAEELMAYNSIKTREEWNRLQVRFLEQHHYWTQTSIASRKAKKDEHFLYLKKHI